MATKLGEPECCLRTRPEDIYSNNDSTTPRCLYQTILSIVIDVLRYRAIEGNNCEVPFTDLMMESLVCSESLQSP